MKGLDNVEDWKFILLAGLLLAVFFVLFLILILEANKRKTEEYNTFYQECLEQYTPFDCKMMLRK